MKKNYFLVTVLLLIFSASFTSCDSEPVDTQLVDTENTPGPGNNNGNDGSGSDTTGSYWPMAVNNEWKYTSTYPGQEEVNMKISGTQTIDGILYYKYEDFITAAPSMPSMPSMPENFSASSTTYTRKNNNDYNVRVSFSTTADPGMPSMSFSQAEYAILKDNLAVGQSWTQQVQQTISFDMPDDMPTDPDFPDMQNITNTITITGTIMEKSATAVLDNVSYNDVIKVKLVQSAMGTGGTSYFWFVKGKGIMKVINEDMDNGNDIDYKINTFTIN